MHELVAAGSSLIRIDYRSFELADSDSGPMGEYRPTNGLIFSRPGLATVLTGVSSGPVSGRVEVYRSPVPLAETEDWDEVVDHTVESVSGDMKVSSVLGDVPDLPVLTPSGAGVYRVRVHARGRDLKPDGVTFEPVEDYLIQVWPQPRLPDTVHRQTDRRGAIARASAAAAAPTLARPQQPVSPAELAMRRHMEHRRKNR
ncbi:hypothetical protein LIX60_30920 [Streptomyces sp. S07_1.15]|uniref:hypothetical protein n=1 Tax=Streptomyces sp. S07_1.15 TaxID=2873925 RepID=UPI001D148AE6|nr:hypothetical protein [Streptomyces sp. S07_1.15]MCC3655796.1 hypothetical protein [Streptomyces sp. S07_1.15]